MVKNPPANAGDERDVILIPESGISPGVGNGMKKAMAPHSSTLA